MTDEKTGLVTHKLRLLIVEDEPLIVMLLEDMLDQLGQEVPRICKDVGSAIDAIQTETFDGAFLDLNLNGKRADPVAEALRARGIPFVLATGAVEDAESLVAVAAIMKPYSFEDIERAVGVLHDYSSVRP